MIGKSSKFRYDINGLRAVAVTAIVLFHFAIPGFQGGFIGVDIFFVISGYLMTSIIYPRLLDNNFSIVEFYLNRGRRIIPGLAFLCFFLLVAGWFILLPFEYKLLGKQVAGSMGFVSNIFNWMEGGYFDLAAREKWLLHTWSLSVEWQFYILYPLVLILLMKAASALTRWLILLLALASFGVSVFLASHAPIEAFYFLQSRAWEMLAGSVVYLFPLRTTMRMRSTLTWIGLSLIFFSLLDYNENIAWPGFAAFLPVMGTALIIAADKKKSIITGHSIVQFIGAISYSIYLWHWPVVVALNLFGKIDQSIWIAIGIFISVLLGYFSFRFIEPLGRKRGNSQPVFSIPGNIAAMSSLVVVIAIVGLFGTKVFATDGAPSRVSKSVEIASMEVENKNPLTKKCFRESGPLSPSCIVGKHKDTISIVVLGDSHANALVTAVANALPETEKGGALLLGYGLCPPIFGIKIKGKDADHQCAKFMNDSLEKLASERPDLPVVVINRTSFYVWGSVPNKLVASSKKMRIIDFNQASELVDDQYLDEFRTHYIDSMCQLAKGHPVYIVKPVPEFPFDVPKTMAKRLQANAGAGDISINMAEYNYRNDFTSKLMEETRQKCNVHILDPVPYLCPNGICMGSVNNRPLYFDSNHLSEYGNKLLVPMFRKIFAQQPVAQPLDDASVGLSLKLSMR